MMRHNEFVSLDHSSNFMDAINYQKVMTADHIFGIEEAEMPEFEDGHIVPAVDDTYNDWCAS